MFGWTRSQVQPIGVDIGHDSVKMLQLEVQGRSLAVRAAVCRPLEPETGPAPKSDELISPRAMAVVREILRHGQFCGRCAVMALPREIVHIKNLRLPQMPVSELAAVVRFEARNVFPFDCEQARVEFLHAGEVRQGPDIRQEVIVLAARHTDVDRYLEQVHRAGLIVDSLDVEPCALYRGVDRFVRRREDEQEVHVLIDLGMKCSQVLIGKGREISFFKMIEIGGGDLNAAVSRKLGISAEEARALRRRLWAVEEPGKRDPVRQAVMDATRSTMESLSREISLCMRYHSVTFRGQRAARVRLLGGEAGDPQLLAILNSTLSVPVEAGRPLFSVDCQVMRGFDRKAASGEWALALGLSLKRTEGRFAPLDGTPRAATPALPPTAEVIDLNAAIAPAAASKDTSAQEDHFAAVRRASAGEAAHA
jgi:type IV pilus assembly protein PilM